MVKSFRKGGDWIKKASAKGLKKRWKNYHAQVEGIISNLRTRKDYILISRLCGFIMGDGCITKDGHEITFYPDIIENAELFKNTFQEIYKKTPKITGLHNYFRVRINLIPASRHLLSIAHFDSLSWRIPKKILINKQAKIEFLKAFFDCEAYVGQRMIQLQSVNKKGLLELQELLKGFDIESRIYQYVRKNKNWNINYILCIMKKESRMNYLIKIGFNHPYKQEKLIKTLRPGSHNGIAPDLSKR